MGIKVLIGKEFQPKEAYLSDSLIMIPLLIKYELINRVKALKSFNN